MQKHLVIKKMVNLFLRVTSLAAKLALTLYMGRFLGLADLGVYGLVFSTVMIATVVLGVRMDFVVGREIVGASSFESLRKIRDQTVFFGWGYGLFALFMLGAYALEWASPDILMAIFLLSVLENLANAYTTNLISMGRPVLSTFLFFIRAGLWCLVAVVVGLLMPALRTVEMVLMAWVLGEVLGVSLTLWAWRRLPWRAVFQTPVDWAWIKRGVVGSFPIWMGSIGAILSFSADRFVVSQFLGLEEVGIITFYGSFATALLALVQSGFFSFSYPKMIHYHKQGDEAAFWREVRQNAWQVCLFITLTTCCIGVLIPFSAPFFQKPELAREAPTLWLMLIGIWIRANADSLYYVLYARHQDRPLWLGSILFLIPALVGNLVLVPWIGLVGVGYSSILACLFLFLWRLWHVRRLL